MTGAAGGPSTRPGAAVPNGADDGRCPASTKPCFAWLPSHIGLLAECPQRHSAVCAVALPATTRSPAQT